MTKHTILFLAANPVGTDRLALGSEARAIRDELERNDPQRLRLETRWAVTPLDLLRILRTLRPTVVHFAGRGQGEPAHGLIVEGDDGRERVVSAAALNRMFGVVGSVRLVVLNACYSAGIADALLPYVDCVVGMSGALSQEAARAFAIGFYGALGAGAPVAAAYAHGKAAIGLDVLDGMAEAERPQLRSRKGVANRLVPSAPSQHVLHAAAANLRLFAHFTGALGVAATCAVLLLGGAGAWRAALALGESPLDVHVRELAVQATTPPQPLQDTNAVAVLSTSVATIDGASPATGSGLPHRVEFSGWFASIDYDHRSNGDPGCRLRFAANDDGALEIERANADGAACRHEVVLLAGKEGLALSVDGASSPVAIAPHARVALQLTPGAPVVLVPRQGRLALFRPDDGVTWQAYRLEGTAADGQRVRLPGALRSSDSFEVTGDLELRELRLDRGEIAVAGGLSHWSGEVGRSGDWDASAPWPPWPYDELAALAFTALAVASWARERRRLRAWERELE